jgi:hypothetical protein
LRHDQDKDKGNGFLKALREFFYGMAVHEHATAAVKEKTSLENLFLLVTFGDTLGVPIVRPYYALRLFPYAFSRTPVWQRALLKERDWSDWSFD